MPATIFLERTQIATGCVLRFARQNGCQRPFSLEKLRSQPVASCIFPSNSASLSHHPSPAPLSLNLSHKVITRTLLSLCYPHRSILPDQPTSDPDHQTRQPRPPRPADQPPKNSGTSSPDHYTSKPDHPDHQTQQPRPQHQPPRLPEKDLKQL